MDFAAKGVSLPKAYVIHQNNEYIGSIGREMIGFCSSFMGGVL
jgi:hypothetical protein